MMLKFICESNKREIKYMLYECDYTAVDVVQCIFEAKIGNKMNTAHS